MVGISREIWCSNRETGRFDEKLGDSRENRESWQVCIYLKQCHNLFRIFNNTELDPLCYKQLLSIMFWFDSWYQETKQTTAQATGSLKDHWKKFIPRLTYKDLKRTIRAFLGVVQFVQMHYPDLHIIPKSMCQDDVENYFSL